MREPSIRGREGIPFWFAHDDFLMLYHKYTIDFPVGGGMDHTPKRFGEMVCADR